MELNITRFFNEAAPRDYSASNTSGVCRLFVHRDFLARPSRCWRLLWATSADADTFVHAEGECSARHFRTRREATAYGIRRYGETAQRFIDPREG